MGVFDALFDPNKSTNEGYGKALKATKKAQAVTNPFYEQTVQSGQDYSSLLADLLGINGADTQRTAQENYMTSPAFDFQFNRGVGALDASAAARGGLQSGKHMMDLQSFGQGLYAQDFSNYLDRLTQGQQTGFAGATGLERGAQARGNLLIGKGVAEDQGRQAGMGNILGIGGTILGGFAGMPAGGSALSRLFSGGASAPQMPTYDNGRINPYATY